eukprot:gene18018-21506_t
MKGSRMASPSHHGTSSSPSSPSSPSSSKTRGKKTLEEISTAIDLRKSEIKEIFKAIRISEIVDLVFLVDCTGSMQPHINQVKNDITTVQSNLSRKFANLDLKFAFVRYTDLDVGRDRTTVLDFTKSPTDFVNFVGRITAGGGGDGPEDIFGGLDAAFSLSWRDRSTKVLIHIADAPCHGTMYHDLQDTYPSGTPDGLTHDKLMASLARKMVNIFDDSLKKHSRNQLSISGFSAAETATLGERIFASVVESVMSFATRMTTAITSSGESEIVRDYILDKTVPDWSRVAETKVVVKRFTQPESLKDCLSYGYEMRMKEAIHVIKMSKNPFAKGSCRLAFHAFDVSEGTHIVLKQAIKLGNRNNSLKRYLENMETQTIAAKFADDFNKKMGSPVIHFTIAKVVQLGDSSFFGLESYFEGDYIKYNNNAGWHDSSVEPILQTFSHWTHYISGGTTMVVDLQGVKTTRGLILTDPAVHSANLLRFGKTNLGPPGMAKFLATHSCNDHCKKLSLPVPSA